MIPGYQILKPHFRSGNIIFHEALEEKTGARVFIESIESDYPSLDDLVGLKNDYEITHNTSMQSALSSLTLVKSPSGVSVIKEYFDGIPLSKYIEGRKLSIPEILEIAIKLTAILEEVHSKSIIHKDVNPSNFLISTHPLRIKLSNFSVATMLAKEQAQATASESLKGSLFYISPEQTGRMNRSIDYRTDFYSLGITIYQLLCGLLPFGYQNVMELVHAHIAKNPLEPSQLDHNIPKMLSDVVMKLIAKNAEDRYQSARGLREDLQQCLTLYEKSGNIQLFEPGADDYSPNFVISEKLYGRDEESRQLIETFEKSRKGAAQLILVAGYSGIGKTRLINEIYKPIARESGYFTSGKYDQYTRNNPYSAIAQAFGNLIRQFLAESSADFQKWKDRIMAALEDGAHVLTDVIPELELLIGKQPPVLKLGLTETQTRFLTLFKKFIQSLTSGEHPLVIFIDDLQWADSGSLELLFHLLSSKEIKNTLFIGAYRDNEVSPSHPLMQTLERLNKSSGGITTVTLDELTTDEVNQLIADSLHQKPESTRGLTELVTSKTRGNPFFINQFIQKLVDEKLIFFDYNESKWQWDTDRIRQMNITDNVVDLLVAKIQNLPEETQHALRLASCVGSRFDLEELATISETDESKVAEAIWIAVDEDLLNPIGQRSKHFDDKLWKDLGITRDSDSATGFQFQHDRIQQAAYSLIPEEERRKTHLQIGRLLMKKMSSRDLNENVFDVVSHFNFAAGLIHDKKERIEIARLNLIAGERAKNANSYQPALSHLRSGMWMIQPEDDEKLYNEYLIKRSECEYLCGNYKESEEMYNISLEKAKSNIEKAEVFARKMQLYENTSRHNEAIRSALDGLKLLGIRLPEKPGQVAILTELLKAKFYLRGKSTEDLKKNRDLKSPELILAMKILMNLWGPAYLHNQNLLALAILRMVNISTRFGNAPESALAYTFYGFVSCAQLKDFKGGYEFGKLGLWLNEKFDDKNLRSKVFVIFAGCIAHWKDQFSATLEDLRRAHLVGIEANDLIYSGYALDFLSKNEFLMGEPLGSVYSKFKGYVHFGRKIHHITTLHHLLTETREVCQLMGMKEDPAVFMEFADQAAHEKAMVEFAEKEGVQLPITAHHVYQAEWRYLTGEYEKALDHVEKAKKTIASMLGLAEEARLNFFHSLALLALANKNPQGAPKNLAKKVSSNQATLGKWMKNAPENFRAKYLLVEAESAVSKKQFEQAAKFFSEAKDAAAQSGIIQDLALVNEKAAGFYRSRGFGDLGKSLLREAILNYRQWGALAKVNLLEQEFAALTGVTDAAIESLSYAGAGGTTSSMLDLQSIFQASTTISGEVVFENLLEKLMRIVMENAGAQTGHVVMVKNDQLILSARGDMKDNAVTLMHDLPIDEADSLPKSIVQFVYHTSEAIILNEPVKDARFSKDVYLIERNPKSVLCLPILQHGRCMAIIYLENNLATGAFTPARMEVLNLLSGQIAVSLENANLYQRQNELSEAYQRFVPYDFISALGHQSILQVKLGDSISRDMTVMFCDIRSYTTLAEGMSSTENFNFINSYLMLVGPVIKKHNGFINHYLGDGFIALFKDSAEDALHAAIEMTQLLQGYNEERRKQNKPPIALGIGLHTGPVMMGIIGDEERHDANVISDAVNVSSRLEGLTKHFGANIVLSETTMDGIRNKSEFQFRHLGRIKVKGKEKMIKVDEVINTDEPGSREKKSVTLDLFNAGLNDYFNRRFTEAAVSFRKVVDLNPQDIAAKRYLEHAARFMVTGVPDDWEGTEEMREK